MNREEALEILHANMESPNLRKHCYAVASVMKALALKLDGNPETWEIAGFLHDADYEKSKDNIEQHTKLIFEWLENHEVETEIKEAILAHGWGFIEGNPEQKNKMEWSLYCCDELTGFIIACTLIRPEKKLSAINVENVLSKWNTKSFAAGVHREQIELCEKKLGIPLSEFIQIALTAMQEIHEDLGL